MFEWLKYIVYALVGSFLLGLVVGCESPDKTQQALLFLQQGKAEGELTLTSVPTAHAGMKTDFYFGGADTTLAFNGSIDFADRVRAVPPFPAEPILPGDEPVPPPEPEGE